MNKESMINILKIEGDVRRIKQGMWLQRMVSNKDLH